MSAETVHLGELLLKVHEQNVKQFDILNNYQILTQDKLDRIEKELNDLREATLNDKHG